MKLKGSETWLKPGKGGGWGGPLDGRTQGSNECEKKKEGGLGKKGKPPNT